MYKTIDDRIVAIVVPIKPRYNVVGVYSKIAVGCDKMKLDSALEHVNQNLLNIQYAVRGPIVARATQIEKEIKKGVKKPFDRVVRANIGDCHALGQAPFTFIRQVQALAACPQLLSSLEIPDDAKERARELLADCTNGSVGAYSPSQGLLLVRRRAAQYLSARDGVSAYPDQIYLGTGASDLIKAVLSLFAGDVNGKPSAVMIPIPQYPVFSGTLAELGIQLAHYYLDESHGWALMADELERSWADASKRSAVRALVVINPGNPTGQVLTRENMEEIIKFAHRRRLFLLADEVYQENIVSKPFLSFKKVMHEMGAPYSSMELASFITASKGWAAECGARAGLAEIPRLSEAARRAFEAMRAVAQCPNLLGQCALDCIGVKKPFDRVVRANIGDCHALGQAPFTFIRQVQALAACPQLLSSLEIPDDAKERARELLADCTNGSVGAYSPSQGLLLVRRRAAQYLSARDGVTAYPDQIYLGTGASDLIKAVLSLFAGDVNGKPSAVMIPIPQYPVFSGTLAELGIQQAHYYLDESHGWALMADELERSWADASKRSAVRALVVINPGNPTGQVLTRENMEEIIKFAHRRRLFLLADEVYQENIVSKPFLSFKTVMHEMGAPYSSMELASFITASKGWAAECGARAGLAEIPRLSEAARRAFEAMRAVAQCPNLLGQCALDCIMKPPAPGEPSYEQFALELATVRRTLRERTATAYEKLNSIPTFSCNPIDASMFAFPRFSVPARAVVTARAHGMTPDEFYCMRLLEETGVCVVPGSGFGQAEGTLHFRTTILHPREEFRYMMEQIANFHVKFLKEYEDERSEG